MCDLLGTIVALLAMGMTRGVNTLFQFLYPTVIIFSKFVLNQLIDKKIYYERNHFLLKILNFEESKEYMMLHYI